ncbi:UDP-glycosyltransferase 90A1-like [Corylus avellana]|uniref:UDP-glycosyltransferase 90A1-like n=1 Tax=Corylus avellana TaxID=13451 RepID=UPI001E22A45A|nr:UDP-glycosyltransferase 90A1-like [Corylus avellana]XP_059449149.1 UDP-glycosyltransferase 90A1-like [Corylus avellana]
MSSNSETQAHHVVLFPFMSKGHTIPILHLAHLLLRRGHAVTVFTTVANRPFIDHSIAHTSASVVDLPFPQNVADDIPAGIESTDKLPSMSLFYSFANCTKHMQPAFERAIETLPRVNFIVSDWFLWWTLESASKFNIPRFVYHGMSYYSAAVNWAVFPNRLLFGPESDDELITVDPFPWVKVTRNDFEQQFREPEPKGLDFEFFMNAAMAQMNSYGVIFNSFHELEPFFVDYWNRECSPKAWSVGPLCLAERPKESHSKPSWVQWLDKKREQGSSVLYVAFGSQADISPAQLKEIAIGLEASKVNFLWVTRKTESEVLEGFEERVKDWGIVVREWVDQREILMHECVQGFLSHCGWNSVLESICAGVPILAWPMLAEQHLNARMVAEEIKVGLRVETVDGSVRGFVKWEGLQKMVRELMEGEMGKEARKKGNELAVMAKKAVDDGGSSCRTIDLLIHETCIV